MPPSAHTPGGDPYVSGIVEERRRKDDYFRASPESPVPRAERASFPPLDYYPVDPSWRMTLPVEVYAKPQTFELVTNLGERRVFRREGHVRFERTGQTVDLQLYREIEPAGPSATLWVPSPTRAQGAKPIPRALPGHRPQSGRDGDARFQPRLQPLLRLRLGLFLSHGPARKPPEDCRSGGGAGLPPAVAVRRCCRRTGLS
jgi:hypothetical protein